MVKIKQTKNGQFKITGLSCRHLEAIATLVDNTRLGHGVYEAAAFELVNAFEDLRVSEYSDFFTPDDCTLSVTMDYKRPTINLVSAYD